MKKLIFKLIIFSIMLILIMIFYSGNGVFLYEGV